jgi:hypothetical protein
VQEAENEIPLRQAEEGILRDEGIQACAKEEEEAQLTELSADLSIQLSFDMIILEDDYEREPDEEEEEWVEEER